jgi:hypothetical protein
MGMRLDNLENQLATEIDRTTRNMQREKGREVVQLFRKEEQAGRRKKAWDTIQDTRKRPSAGAGRAIPWARGQDGTAARAE